MVFDWEEPIVFDWREERDRIGKSSMVDLNETSGASCAFLGRVLMTGEEKEVSGVEGRETMALRDFRKELDFFPCFDEDEDAAGVDLKIFGSNFLVVIGFSAAENTSLRR